jgi:hypothetical protein
MRLNCWKNRNGQESGFANGQRPVFLEGDPLELRTRKSADRQETEKKKNDAEKGLTDKMGETKKAIQDYNDRFTAKDYWTSDYKYFGTDKDDEIKREENPQEQPLVIEGKGVADIQAQVDTLLSANLKNASKIKDKRRKALENVKKLLGEWKGNEEGQLKAKEQYAGYRANRLQERGSTVEDLETEHVALQGNDDYKNEYLPAVNHAVDSVLADKSYKKFFQEEGKDSPRILNENRNLFLSILASQTDNFKAGAFPLGPEFQNDEDQNKKNFPFLYHEWGEKRKVEDQKMGGARADMEQIFQTAKVSLDDKSDSTKTDFADSVGNLLGNKGLKNRVKEYADANGQLKASERYLGYESELGKMQGEISNRITELRKGEGNDPEIKELKEISERLGLAKKAVLKAVEYYRLDDENGEAKAKFTLENLQGDRMRQWLIEAMLKQYLKAQEIVDEGYGKYGGNSKALLNPSVRLAMVAMVYREGVAGYTQKQGANGEKVEGYNPSTAGEYRWAITELGQSPYFNALLQGEFLDEGQQDVLLLMRYANRAVLEKADLQGKEKKMRDILEKSKKDEAGAQKDLEELNKISPNLPPLSIGKLDEAIKQVVARTGQLLKLQTDVHSLLIVEKDPAEKDEAFRDRMMQKTKTLLGAVGTDTATYGYLVEGKNNSDVLDGFGKYIHGVDRHYHVQEFNPASPAERMKYFGLKLEGFYASYNTYRQQHSEMDVSRWDEHLMKGGDIDSLIKMFGATLDEGKIAGGKEDFLQTLRTLHGKYPMEVGGATRDAQSVAISVYNQLKEEVRNGQRIDDSRANLQKELDSRLDGMTFADKIPETAKSVIDMVIGPGQSLTNRAAGLAILAVAFKLLKGAWEGKTVLGKAARYTGLAMALELVVKKVTGAGLLDRANVTGIADAMKGMHESVLIKRGESMDITKEEHARALVQLNKVPMKDVLEWYRNSTPDGQKLPGGRDLFPKGIESTEIVKGIRLKEMDEEVEARRVVKRSVRNFLEYVGEKQRGGAETGLRALEERYVKPFADPNYRFEKTEGTEFELSKTWLEQIGRNPAAVTWEGVMRSEVRWEDVDKVAKGGMLNALADKFEQAIDWTKEKVRVDLLPLGGHYAKSYYHHLNAKYGNIIPETAEKGLNFVEDKENEIKIWWETGQDAVRIRKMGKDTWQIVKAGVFLPYVATLHVTEATTARLKDMIGYVDAHRKEWLENEEKVTIDLFPPNVDLEKDTSTDAENARQFLLDRMNAEGFKMFGRFEKDFFQTDDDTTKARGLLARPHLLDNPGHNDARIKMNENEGYVVFMGMSPEGNSTKSFQEGVENLIRFLKDHVSVIDPNSPLGKAVTSNNDEEIKNAVEPFLDRFGSFNTEHNGYLTFMHFPFPVVDAIRNRAEYQEQVLRSDGTLANYTRVSRYRNRYNEMREGKELPRFDVYKHSIRLSPKDNFYNSIEPNPPFHEPMGFLEDKPASGQWYEGNYAEKYMEAFHIFSPGDQSNPGELDDVLGAAFQKLDGRIVTYDAKENKADAVYKMVMGQKSELARLMPETSYEKTYKQLNDTSISRGGDPTEAAAAFREIHTDMRDHFVAPSALDRAGQLKDAIIGEENTLELKYREYLMEKLSEKYRKGKGQARISRQDVIDVSKQFVLEHESFFETNCRRLVGLTVWLKQKLDSLLNRAGANSPVSPRDPIK